VHASILPALARRRTYSKRGHFLAGETSETVFTIMQYGQKADTGDMLDHSTTAH